MHVPNLKWLVVNFSYRYLFCDENNCILAMIETRTFFPWTLRTFNDISLPLIIHREILYKAFFQNKNLLQISFFLSSKSTFHFKFFFKFRMNPCPIIAISYISIRNKQKNEFFAIRIFSAPTSRFDFLNEKNINFFFRTHNNSIKVCIIVITIIINSKM